MLDDNELEQRVEQAVSLGATREEVESAVRHGTQRQRETVSGAFERMEPHKPIGRPPVVASETALVASVIEGTDSNSYIHETSSLAGGTNIPIKDAVRRWKAAFGQRDASEFVEGEDFLDYVMRVEEDPAFAVGAMVYEAAMQLPEVTGEYDNANHYRLLRERDLKLPLAIRAQFPSTDHLEDVFYRLPGILSEHSEFFKSERDIEDQHGVMTGARGAALEMIPLKGGRDFLMWSKTAFEMGVLESAGEVVKGAAVLGWVNRKIQDHIRGLPADEQAEFIEEFMKTWVDNLGGIQTPFAAWFMAEGILSPEFLANMEPSSRTQYIIENVASALALLETAIVGRNITLASLAVRGALPAFRSSGKLLFQSRPKRYANFASGVVRRMSEAEFAQKWGISKMDVVNSQLPKPIALRNLENVPDDILKHGLDEDRLGFLIDAATEQSRVLSRNIHSTDERLNIISKIRDEATSLFGHQLRPAMSRMELFEDDSGFRFLNVLGKDAETGFGSLSEAALVAQRYADFEDLTFYRLDPDGLIKPFKPRVQKARDGKWEPVPGQTGEFFVEFPQVYYFSPLDAMAFDGAPVLTAATLSRIHPGAPRNIGVPSSHLNPEIWGKWANATSREQGLIQTLDSITAPVFKSLSHKQQLEVNDMLKWAEKYGVDNGVNPPFAELKAAFPDAAAESFGGFYQSRVLFDTLYQIQNDRLYRAWQRDGYKTLKNKETQFHGTPVPASEITSLVRSRGSIEVLDASTMKTVTIDETYLSAIMKDASVIRMALPMESTSGVPHRLVLGNSSNGFRLSELSRSPLKYVPGYYPRMYKDNHYIQITRAGRVDGADENIKSVVAVAPTRREADRHLGRLLDDEGARLFGRAWDSGLPLGQKAQLLKNRGYQVEVLPDSRLSVLDRDALDLQRFQVEGRLFFDNRNQKPLVNVYRQEADAVDPINTLQRSVRMTSRQVAREDLGQQQRLQFFETFQDRLPFLSGMRNATTDEVKRRLLRHAKESRGDDLDIAHQAYSWWNHIHAMSSGMQGDVAAVRRLAIEAAEFLDYNVGWKLGGKRVRGWSIEMSRNAHLFDPVRSGKQLTHAYFIKGRPVRQWVLQGLQHMNIAAIDPSYLWAGRWQRDSWSLLSSTWRMHRWMEGDKVSRIHKTNAAREMGYSQEEFDKLLREFSVFTGQTETVNIHSYAGGLPKSTAHVPRTASGTVTQNVWGGATLPIQKAGQYGFESAEQYNVAASWLMALRRHKKETGISDLRKFTQDDWDSVNKRGRGYAMAMDVSNGAGWQYGLISFPLTFLQYTHKWALTMMNAVPGAPRIGLGNLAFTPQESRRIAAGQLLLWGTAGFGLRELWQRVAGEAGLDPQTVANKIAMQVFTDGGLDYFVNSILNFVAQGDDSDLDVSGSFAPAAQWRMTLTSLGEATLGGKLAKHFLGPHKESMAAVVRMVRTVNVLTGDTIEGMSEPERAQAVLQSIAAGFMATPSDYLKVKMAHRVGEWTNSSGVGLGPGFETKLSELVAKGLFGINTKRVSDFYDFQNAIADREEHIKSDARQAYENISRIVATWGDGRLSDQHAIANMNLAMQHLSLYPDEEDAFVYVEELRRLALNDRPGRPSFIEQVADVIARTGGTPSIIHQIKNSAAFTREEQEQLALAIERAEQLKDLRTEREMELLEDGRDIVRRLRENENE